MRRAIKLFIIGLPLLIIAQRFSTASGSERGLLNLDPGRAALATARGT